MPQSTLGYERRFNWAFAVEDESEFVEQVLAGQSAPPTYFAEMKRLNREGPLVLPHRPEPRELPTAALVAARSRDAVLVDVRSSARFIEGHLPGTLSIPLGRSFTGWAGWLLPYDRDIYFVVSDTGEAARNTAGRAALELSLIGVDRVAGYFTREVLDSWQRDGGALEKVAEIDAATLDARLARGEVQLIDVRGHSEWDAEHIAGSRNIPLGDLAADPGAVDGALPVVTQCASGARSTIASSVLLARGVPEVISLAGGIAAWRDAQLPLTRSD
jgi:hydroxyacylglutathione hydrolase